MSRKCFFLCEFESALRLGYQARFIFRRQNPTRFLTFDQYIILVADMMSFNVQLAILVSQNSVLVPFGGLETALYFARLKLKKILEFRRAGSICCSPLFPRDGFEKLEVQGRVCKLYKSKMADPEQSLVPVDLTVRDRFCGPLPSIVPFTNSVGHFEKIVKFPYL